VHSLTTTKRLKLRTLEEVSDVAHVLAQAFPDPARFRIGIHELLINAIEHGNLDLGHETKTALLQRGEWEREIHRRLALPEFSLREVEIRLSENDRLCCLTIEDEGKGFPWQKHFEHIANGQKPNGRGLLIASNCGFDRFVFNLPGNRVTCAARY